jgi:hypothetical protein
MTQQMSALSERMLHRAVSPLVILEGESEESIRQQIAQGLEIENATRRIVSGEASIWETCEMLEIYGHDMDQWANEIELNLTYGLIQLHGR